MVRSRFAHQLTAWFLQLFVSVLLLWSEPAFGLEPRSDLSQFKHEVWLTENGLPQNTVHAIAQTRDGFIWIATEEGLARFDGINFAVFHKQNTPELSSNDVRALAEDAQGSLWIGTADGLVQFKDVRVQSFPVQGALPSKVIESLYEPLLSRR